MLDLYFLAGIFILIFLMVYFVHGEYALIGFVILTFLVIPSNLSATLRTVIQIMDFAILFYLFLKRYGLNFREYPHVPGYAILFLIILYSSLFSHHNIFTVSVGRSVICCQVLNIFYNHVFFLWHYTNGKSCQDSDLFCFSERIYPGKCYHS